MPFRVDRNTDKPHISRSHALLGLWLCVGYRSRRGMFGGLSSAGYGKTPRMAYNAWKGLRNG